MNQEFKTPPKTTNPAGDERGVGYEFEFTGVEMEETAAIVANLYGGQVQQKSTFEFEISETAFGDFKLELDAQMIREKKYEKLLKTFGIDFSNHKDQEQFEDSLKDLASSVVPFEIITPPISLSSMHELKKLVDELRIRKAKGTGSSIVYAFGLHLNPEIPGDSAESVLNHMKAFVLLDSWIRKDAEIDMSRRLTPFINRFENDYVQNILKPDYKPNLEQLIEDYFAYGNSRNRPLDMQPLFMYLNKDLTSGLIEDTLTSARPTYHYRLPNCSLDDENWTLESEWNRWILVERLAADEKSLDQYSRAYLKMRGETLIGFETKWTELMNRWVQDVEE